MLPVEVLTHAIRSTDTPEEAAVLIQKYESIRVRVAERKRRSEDILKAAREQVKVMFSEQLCAHEVCKRSADPSGGSDSGTQCLICNEWLNERETRFT